MRLQGKPASWASVSAGRQIRLCGRRFGACFDDPQGKTRVAAKAHKQSWKMPGCRALERLTVPLLPLSLGVLLGLAPGISPLDNGLLRTPPMGWEPWLRFKCNTDCAKDPENCISEHLIKAMADRLAVDGWKELGYEYVTLDDCWAAGKRDVRGRLQADPQRFPSGMKALADYVHSKGLKFGIYSDLGNATCAGYPGTTLDTVETDANTFAEWGVDMLKLDGCFSDSSLKAIGYPKMSRALNQTGRPIALSCSWPAYEGGLPPKVNYTLLGQICNFWRNYADIEDTWDSLFHIIEWYGDNQDILQPASGPGRWNDPDMAAWHPVSFQLIVSDFGLSHEQSKVQAALWAILAAPFFISCNLRNISEEAKDMLQNPLLIYINQDLRGVQGRLLARKQNFEVWKRPLVNGQYAVAVLNNRTDGAPQSFATTPSLLGISDCRAGYRLYDVLGKLSMGIYASNDTISAKATFSFRLETRREAASRASKGSEKQPCCARIYLLFKWRKTTTAINNPEDLPAPTPTSVATTSVCRSCQFGVSMRHFAVAHQKMEGNLEAP
ncbi:alpha-N-acetylgalactosaminidase-like isoform X2 [Ahaetulla prasina]|uniref:alpha-N-acetylgalactosaminidase-like isoform X2 n=1 Tax=Ahaetulla prasina TaxID=499056 RepID=UPI002647D2A2|nr:alpha-N-acetylgalactosaminidase-like isoform X2 [Ahaetulla prasina]